MATHKTQPTWTTSDIHRMIKHSIDANVGPGKAQFSAETVQFLLDVIAEKDAEIKKLNDAAWANVGYPNGG